MEEYFHIYSEAINGEDWPLFQALLSTIAVLTCQAQLMKALKN